MKLVYFNGRGLAETTRLLFAISKIEYTDYRYPIEIIDWKNYNMKKEEFENDKKAGILLKSLNKLPFLVIDDQIIPQSKAIERYVAKQADMMGSNHIEEAQIDSICECIRDFKDAYQKVRKTDEDKKEEAMQEWFSVTLKEKLELLENIVNNKFSIGNKISLADIVIYSFITQFFDNMEGAYKATETTLNIRSVVDNVASNENIKNWLKNRPETSF